MALDGTDLKPQVALCVGRIWPSQTTMANASRGAMLTGYAIDWSETALVCSDKQATVTWVPGRRKANLQFVHSESLLAPSLQVLETGRALKLLDNQRQAWADRRLCHLQGEHEGRAQAAS